MSDYFSGYHRKQPWLHHWPDQNIVTSTPYFAFSSCCYFSDHFANEHLLHHHHQPDNTFAKLPQPTTDLRIRAWYRGGAKAYFRFHGGIGDGCYSIACRNAEQNTATRRLQLFDALNPIDFKNDMLKMTTNGGFVKIPVIGPPVLPAEASGGTGVFLPVYPKRIRATKDMHVRGDDWQQRRHGGRMKQEDTFSKSFEGGDAVEKTERTGIDEIPLEFLLPSEWIY